ncbi:antigen-presenting glycoprotein CD1d-like [Hemicordylus capensis]|uniref:antigen-presenting glycoprotein CD1d-like n=1 Tax=Hemicordylus capensis TaxID=884348 RepID=UPI0023022A37|nr:antigen-presenting glycoprotein CD1d-like [Hemicordylus capensis]
MLSPLRVWTQLLLLLLSSWTFGVSYAYYPHPVGPHSLRFLQTAVFHSAGVADIEAIALLEDVETHSLDKNTGEIIFHQPWSKSALSPQDWKLFGNILRAYFIGFKETIDKMDKVLNVSYPLVTQSFIFCEEVNRTKRGFYVGAVNGEAIVTFSASNGTWIAQEENQMAHFITGFLNLDIGTAGTLRLLLSSQCIKALESFLQTGKATLQRQEKPTAVVFTHESAAIPDSLLLVCRVTGFYPHPINISWLQNEKEISASSQVNSTEILPNHDLTYQIRSSLVIQATDTNSYTCRVQHSSLGGKDLIIPWRRGQKSKAAIYCIVLIAIIFVVVAIAVYYWRRRRQYEDISRTEPVA